MLKAVRKLKKSTPLPRRLRLLIHYHVFTLLKQFFRISVELGSKITSFFTGSAEGEGVKKEKKDEEGQTEVKRGLNVTTLPEKTLLSGGEEPVTGGQNSVKNVVHQLPD